jgi:hypothetical protein
MLKKNKSKRKTVGKFLLLRTNLKEIKNTHPKINNLSYMQLKNQQP